MVADLPTISFADISAAGGPPDQWDALPTAAKGQILLGVMFLELWGESSIGFEAAGKQHSMRGGQPGYYPPFGGFPPLNLFDPFGLTKKPSAGEIMAPFTEINADLPVVPWMLSLP